jgi:dnd system-associated protein 4
VGRVEHMKNIRYSSKYNELIDQFVSSKGRHHFRTIREFLVFAASLGYTIGAKRKPSEPLDLILDSRNQMDDATIDSIYSIGLAYSKSKDILSTSKMDNLAYIFEEYLEGGLDCINTFCIKNSTDSTERNTTLLHIFTEHNLIELDTRDLNISDIKF